MKTILIEVNGGSITNILNLENAPKEGILIFDHDNIKQSEDQEEAAKQSLNTYYEVDGISDYNQIIGDLFSEYKNGLREYFSLTGYWKDTNEVFADYIVTNFDDLNEDDPYSEEDIFMFGLSESNLAEAVEQKENTAHDFVVTSYTRIIQ